MSTAALEKQPLPAISNTPLQMDYQEYLSWVNEDAHTEWVNGEVIIQMPPKEEHQRIIDFLIALLVNFVHMHGLGRIISAPFEMKLPDGSAREPDLLFVAQDHLERLTRARVEGPADLVVEVVSRDSVYRDRVDKFEEYEAAGVREYWIIDARSGRQRAEFYQLDPQGRYRLAQVDENDLYYSVVLPGFWLKVAWLWLTPAPNPLLILSQIVGADQLIAFLQSHQTIQ